MEVVDMTDKRALEVHVVNDEVDSTLNVISNSSGNMCNSQLLEASIEDAKNKKIILVSKMNSVKNLMKQLEYEEKAVEEAKAEAGLTCSDIFANVDESKQALLLAQEKTNKLAQKVKQEKYVLTNKIDAFQLRVEQMLDDGDRALAVLEEMQKSLEMRLASALMRKEIANKKKQVRDKFISLPLLDQEVEMKKAVEEFKRLEQEEFEISKLQELLIDRGNVVDILHGEISNKCLDVLLLKEEFDQAILPGGIFWSERTVPSYVNSSSFEKVEEYENGVFEDETNSLYEVDKIKEDEHEMIIEAFVASQSTIKSPENKNEVFEAETKTSRVVDKIKEDEHEMLIECIAALEPTIKSTEYKNEVFEADIKVPLVVEEITEEVQAMLIEDWVDDIKEDEQEMLIENSAALQSSIKSPEIKIEVFKTDIKIPLVGEETTEEKHAMLIEDMADTENDVVETDIKKSLVVEEITEEEQAMLNEDWVVLQSTGSEDENSASETDIKESVLVEDVKEEEQTMLIEDSIDLQSTIKSTGNKIAVVETDIEAPVVIKDVTKKRLIQKRRLLLQSIMKNKYFRENQRDVGTKEADTKAPVDLEEYIKEKQAMLSEGSAISHTTMKNEYFGENQRDVGTKEADTKAPVDLEEYIKEKQAMLSEGSAILHTTMKNEYFGENQRDVGTKEADTKAPVDLKEYIKEKQAMLSEGSSISHTTMKNKYFRENQRDVATKKVNKPTEDQMPANNDKSADANQKNEISDALVFCIILFMFIALWFVNGFSKGRK